MRSKTRHRILGCKFNGSPDRWAARYKKDFFGLGNYAVGWDPRIGREDDIRVCLGMLALQHLGYRVPVDASEFLDRGWDVVVDYFCGVWWKEDADSRESLDKSR